MERYGPLVAGAACLLAPAEVGLGCVRRLLGLLGAGYFSGVAPWTRPMLEGIERLQLGDAAGAAAAWRPLAREAQPPWLVACALDRAGLDDLAAVLDAPMVARRGDFNGASEWTLRAAKRAARTGDSARARELASKMIDAWAAADVEVPALVEMRSLARAP